MEQTGRGDTTRSGPQEGSWGEEANRLSRLAWPVALGALGSMGLNVVDTIVVGQLGQRALAAVSLGSLWAFGCLVFGRGLLRGLDPFFSQPWGGDDAPALGRALGRALVLAVSLAAPLTAMLFVMAPVMRLLGQPVEVIPVAAEYCRALAPGILPALLFTALAQCLQGMEVMRPPMVAILIGNALNVALDLVLILGWEAAGIPAMGAWGCGVATSLVRWGMLFGLVWLSWPRLRALELGRPSQWVRPRPLVRMLAVGAPVGAQSCLESWAFGALGLMMGVLGELELAAHAVAINVVAMAYMIPFGIGAAASTRVGNLIGARRPWRRAAWVAVAMGAAWMAGSALVLLVAGRPIARLFIDEAQVVALVVALMPVAAAFQVFDGVQAVAFGALRGAGDTRLPALANMIGYWVVGLPLGYLIGIEWTGDPRALWGGVALALAVVAGLLLWRLRAVMRRGGEAIAGA